MVRWEPSTTKIVKIARCAARAFSSALALGAALSCGASGEAPGSGVESPPVKLEMSGVPGAASAAVPSSPPACEEKAASPGPWPRATGLVRAIAGKPGEAMGWLEQPIEGRGAVRLRFLGTHVFDLLDKLAAEGGPDEASRRRMICAALNAVAERGAPVVRIWGTLKRTGTAEEIERARAMLGLVLDENARRARPLRFVVSLLNHQPGYGLPSPEVSLDDQKTPGWSAREVYLSGAWQRRGIGQLAERIERYREDVSIRSSPYVLAWELVNELDTHRSVAGGSFGGAAADRLVSAFLAPAAAMLAEGFSQPIAFGDLRGALYSYSDFAERAVEALSPAARARLVWTAHVYLETTDPPPSEAERRALAERGTRKLDVDMEIARSLGLPFFLGEIGQHVRGAKTAYCAGGARHDIPGLLQAALAPDRDPRGRRDIEAAVFWGEGLCGLTIDAAAGWRVDIGAGGDSADLGPGEAAARDAVAAARGWPRFLVR